MRPYRIQSRLLSSRRDALPLDTWFLTGTDALRLDTLVRPYTSQSRLVSSRSFDNGRTDRASLQDSVTASIES